MIRNTNSNRRLSLWMPAAAVMMTSMAGAPRAAHAQSVDDIIGPASRKQERNNAFMRGGRIILDSQINKSGNPLVSLGLVGLSHLFKHRTPQPRIFPGMVQNTDISYAALAWALMRDRNRMQRSEYLAEGITSTAGSYVVGKATGNNVARMVAPEVAMPFVQQLVEKKLDKKDDDLVSNSRLAREIITFLSDILGNDNMSFATADELKTYLANYSGPRTQLTEKFLKMMKLEKKYYPGGNGPIAELVDNLATDMEAENKASSSPLTLAEFRQSDSGPFAGAAGDKSRAQLLAEELVLQACNKQPKLIYGWLPIAMKRSTKVPKTHPVHHSADAARIETASLNALHQFHSDHPDAPIAMTKEGAVLKGTDKKIIFQSLHADQSGDFSVEDGEDSIKVSVANDALPDAVWRAVFRQIARLESADDNPVKIASVPETKPNANNPASVMPEAAATTPVAVSAEPVAKPEISENITPVVSVASMAAPAKHDVVTTPVISPAPTPVNQNHAATRPVMIDDTSSIETTEALKQKVANILAVIIKEKANLSSISIHFDQNKTPHAKLPASHDGWFTTSLAAVLPHAQKASTLEQFYLPHLQNAAQAMREQIESGRLIGALQQDGAITMQQRQGALDAAQKLLQGYERSVQTAKQQIEDAKIAGMKPNAALCWQGVHLQSFDPIHIWNGTLQTCCAKSASLDHDAAGNDNLKPASHAAKQHQLKFSQPSPLHSAASLPQQRIDQLQQQVADCLSGLIDRMGNLSAQPVYFDHKGMPHPTPPDNHRGWRVVSLSAVLSRVEKPGTLQEFYLPHIQKMAEAVQRYADDGSIIRIMERNGKLSVQERAAAQQFARALAHDYLSSAGILEKHIENAGFAGMNANAALHWTGVQRELCDPVYLWNETLRASGKAKTIIPDPIFAPAQNVRPPKPGWLHCITHRTALMQP